MARCSQNFLAPKERHRKYQTYPATVEVESTSYAYAKSTQLVARMIVKESARYLPIELTSQHIDEILPALFEQAGEDLQRQLILHHLTRMDDGALVAYASDVLRARK